MDVDARRLGHDPALDLEVDAVKEAQRESPYWYRVSEIRPKLREHAQVHRHRYRGEVWYVLEDPTAERFHRFTPAIYELLQLFDGENTVEEILEASIDLLGDDAPTQQELIGVISQLHSADALATQVEPDTSVFLERMAKMKKTKLVGQLANPLFLKIPLFDPERLTVWGMRYLKPLFTLPGFFVWLAFSCVGLTLTALHWGELSEDVIDRVLAQDNLLLLWLVFPVVKGLHEMGHAFMTKAFGGESHEMGVMLLLLMPLPYVDASSASRFKRRRERVLVGFAGMMVEMWLGTIALIAWVYLEPGLWRSLAYNVFFTAGVSTIVFNLNPLLRYDGYYILADMLEIPNLRAKSMNYLLYLLERYGFGSPDSKSPATQVAERNWLALYAPCSLMYRVLVISGIIWAIATQFFFLGAMIAVSTSFMWVCIPLFKAWKYLKASPRLRQVRTRALAVSGGFVGCLVVVPLFIPMPLNTLSEGVVWLPEEGLVRAGVAGWVSERLANSDEDLDRGEPVLLLEDSDLMAQIRVAIAREEELSAQLQSLRPGDVVGMQVVREQLDSVQDVLSEMREDQEMLTVRASQEGVFHYIHGLEFAASFVKRGDIIGTVLVEDDVQVLAMISQEEIDLLRARRGKVEVRFADEIEEVYEAVIIRETPMATQDLPSVTLATQGGGRVAIDPTDPDGQKAFDRWFQVELDVPHRDARASAGGRVYVRFNHGFEPLSSRWARSLRRLFLSEFAI